MASPEQPESYARIIIDGFNRHFQLFSELTQKAGSWFAAGDWQQLRAAVTKRIGFYDTRVAETIAELKRHRAPESVDLWRRIKAEYLLLLQQGHLQPELAESFYNTVFCRVFASSYYNNSNIFQLPVLNTDYIIGPEPEFLSFAPPRAGFQRIAQELLQSLPLRLELEDLRRDSALVRSRLESSWHQNNIEADGQLQILTPIFYRNKGAYVVGRIADVQGYFPFVVALQRHQGKAYVDAVLTASDDIAAIFSFARAYFLVDAQVPAAVVRFLQSLMPDRTSADLYTAIGFQKHGKTAFYRDFLHHLHNSSDQLVLAPGIEGLVMQVFMLPSYPYVFKVIKDPEALKKNVTEDKVKSKYQLVKQHDRVGRMTDTLEFAEVALPRARFSEDLLAKLQSNTPNKIKFVDDNVVLKHIYIERRLTPLNLYLDQQRAIDKKIAAVLDYGSAIREIAEGGIFPADMPFKNFGVMPDGKVVYYDYDELVLMTEMRPRLKPQALEDDFLFDSEISFTVDDNDFFPEELRDYLYINRELFYDFAAIHGDLFSLEFWQSAKKRAELGQFPDIYPYPTTKRFHPMRSSG